MTKQLLRLVLIFVFGFALLVLGACNDRSPKQSIEPGIPTPSPTVVVTRKTTQSTPASPKRSYTNLGLAFSLDYPEGWQIIDKNAKTDGVRFVREDRSALLWVQRQAFAADREQANRAGISYLKGLNARSEISDVQYRSEPLSFRVAGLSGLSLEYTYVSNNDVPMGGTFVAATTEAGQTYLLTFEALQTTYVADLSVFESFVQGIRFTGVAVDSSTPVSMPTAARDEAEWLVMLYMDADDNILERDILTDLNELERVGSTDNVQIVAQVDRYRGGFSGMGNWTTAKRFFITRDNDLNQIGSPQLADLGEVNMASGETLTDFITWAVTNYPAKKHALILSDHGFGWPGGFSDEAPGGAGKDRVALANELGDGLWLMELDHALTDARTKTGLEKFDLVGFDACLMGMLEVFTTMAPHARYSVASEELEPSLGWAYTSFMNELVANPSMTGADLSRAIVDTYIVRDQRIVDSTARRQLLKENDLDEKLDTRAVVKEFSADITLSAVDLDALTNVNTALNNLTAALMNGERKKITAARTAAQKFENTFDENAPSPYIDLGSFVKLLQKNSDDAQVTLATENLLSALEKAVLVQRHGPERPGATGIAIYFPNRTLYRTENNWEYSKIAERFSDVSNWDDFLGYLYGRQTRSVSSSRSVTRFSSLVTKPVSMLPVTLTTTSMVPGSTVTATTVISTENLSYAYRFVGRKLADEKLILIADMEYVLSDSTENVDGVAYPVWPDEQATLQFDWKPVLRVIHDGNTDVQALFTPVSYGVTSTYTVDGIYTFVDGSPARFARLYFRDGQLSQVFGYPGRTALGAPREITPVAGDRFAVLEQGFRLSGTALGANVEEGGAFTREGGVLTFGDQPFTIREIPAPADSYVLGFIAEDLDGHRYEQFDSVFVRNQLASVVDGYAPYVNPRFGIALLYPKTWELEEGTADAVTTFTDNERAAIVMVLSDHYTDVDSALAANERGLSEALKLFKGGREIKNLRIDSAAQSTRLGGFAALRRELSFTLDGEPLRVSAIVSTPTPEATYTILLVASASDFDSVQSNFSPMLDSFNVLKTGLGQKQLGPLAPSLQTKLFSDNFSSNRSGLVEDDGDWGRASYLRDGRYSIQLQPNAGPIYDFYADQTLPVDFMLQVATRARGTENNGYGLIFRVTNQDEFYAFRISRDGFFSVDKSDGEELIPLIDWTASDQIKTTSNATNLLVVTGSKDAYRLFINGRQVASFTDNDYQGEQFGIIADNFDEERTTNVEFDNLVMGQIEP